MRIIKWVFGGLAAIVVILGLAWVMVPKDRIINFALDQVEAQIGRDISVGGDADLKIFPNLVVVADQVSVANADWSDRGAMMTADRLDVSVSMAALFGGDIVISRLSLIRPDILLERNESGQANWVFGSDQPQMRDTSQTDNEADQAVGSDGTDVPLIGSSIFSGANMRFNKSVKFTDCPNPTSRGMVKNDYIRMGVY